MTETAESPQHPTYTYDELRATLTGYDEQAIEKAFSAELIRMLMQGSYSKVGRALVFILKRREGLDDKAAKKAVMEMPLGEIDAYFEDEQDLDPDEPETEGGKDDSPDD